MEKDLIEMSRREREVLKVMRLVLEGKRTQREAGRLLGRSERQIRRIQRRLEQSGDAGIVHQLRGRASNNQLDAALRKQMLSLYQKRYRGLGPTFVSEKPAEREGLKIHAETLGQLLLKEKLWKKKRRRDVHRKRRQRRACFGEMVQADASDHDWLEGRGPRLALVGMIDDATSRVVARFHESETTEAYMDVRWRWIQQYGRPLIWYSDRHGIFRAEDQHGESTLTQFSRALGELDINLIPANFPQAKGRIERLWQTAQQRLLWELRLAGARTLQEANRVLEQVFIPWFNDNCTEAPASANDAHRPLDKSQNLTVILSIQQQRTVSNDYTIRFESQVHQLLPPGWPGQRGGKVIVEKRLDGSMRIRFKNRYLQYRAAARQEKQHRKATLGALPPAPRSLSHEPIPTGRDKEDRATMAARPAVHHPPNARVPLLRSPVLPAAAVVVQAKRPGVQRPTIRGARPPKVRRTLLL